MDCIAHGVAKSLTPLSDFQFHFQNTLSLLTLCPCSSELEDVVLSLKLP